MKVNFFTKVLNYFRDLIKQGRTQFKDSLDSESID